MEVYQQQSRANTRSLRAALDYTDRGIPVFPCQPGRKKPLTKRGHLDATTDPRRITAWWTKWPDANIGIPTGKRSGVLALDVDGTSGREALLAAHGAHGGRGPMPATTTVKTGSGGLHYLFSYPEDGPEIRNSAGRLGPGLDVRGEGGYIIAPPSVTEGPYKVLDRSPLAPPPQWLVEALQAEVEGSTSTTRLRSGATSTPIDLEEGGAPIPKGERNDTLARIAGKLHDGTRTLDELAADLEAINRARCKPPIGTLPEDDPGEVRKIARSIHGRGPCTPGPGPAKLARKRLKEIEADVFDRAWPGMGGKTERDVTVALIKTARQHSSEHPEGVEVSIDVRALALAAAIPKKTLTRKGGALDRLYDAKVIKRGRPGARGRAGTFILLTPPAQDVTHSSTTEGVSREDAAANSFVGNTLRAPRLRWSAVRREWVAGDYQTFVTLRLGKTSGAVIDILEREGGSATIPEMAEILGIKRPRDLRRRVIARLRERGIVTVSGDTVSLVEDWLDALDREREVSGEIEAHRRDMVRYNLERRAYRDLRQRGQLLTKEERRERARVNADERREARRAAWALRRKVIREADRAAPNARLWSERRADLEADLLEEDQWGA